jgi:Iron-containing redox enzyme
MALAASDELHATLNDFNRERLRPMLPEDAGQFDPIAELGVRRREHDFVEAERRAVAAQAASAPRDPDGFVAWYEGLEATGPGQGDPLFPWIAEEASEADLRWFLRQEVAGEAGFEDLLALTQVRVLRQAKLELARNFWDEMGRGEERGMHGPMLDRLAREVDVAGLGAPLVWETLALANLMVALAANRRYAFQSMGALGIIEQTAPGRAEKVNRGLTRLGLSGSARQYFALHATLDRQHAAAWNREVLPALVAEDPRTATALAEGALMRLGAGARCFARYRAELWGPTGRTSR